MCNYFLYKYLDISGALLMMYNKELQFTNPMFFNDPFDCHPELFDYSVPEGYSYGWAPKPFIRDKARCDCYNEWRRVWACCLSKRNDSMLMWSYYTNHKGVCIGLNNNALSAHLTKSVYGLTVIEREVQYKDIREKPNGISGASFLYQLYTKSVQWQHEQEVRYVIVDPHLIRFRIPRKKSRKELISWEEVRFYPNLTNECFDSIYLGVRISESDKLKIIKAVNTKFPTLKVYQMVADYENFSFNAVPVDVKAFLSEHKESLLKRIWSKFKYWSPFTIRMKISYNKDWSVRRIFRI